MLDEIKNIQSGRRELKNFGITIGLILLLIAGFLFYKGNELYLIISYISGFFIGLGIILPKLLKPFYLVWMTFALVLGWLMTRLILSLLFFVIISFIKLISGFIGIGFLETNKTNQSTSYWNHRVSEIERNQDYTKQF